MQKRGETVAGHSNGARAETELPFAKHVAQRTVVLPELKVLFVPIPKGGCTSLLWLLSGLSGMQLEPFLHSTLPEVSPSLTVHDMSLWPEGLRLVDYEGDERARGLEVDGGVRSAGGRDPG